LLFAGNGYTRYSSHILYIPLTLPLLMLRLKFVDNSKYAFATDDNVVGADLLDTCTHFHADRTSFA
jgi:hypothetical protein